MVRRRKELLLLVISLVFALMMIELMSRAYLVYDSRKDLEWAFTHYENLSNGSTVTLGMLIRPSSDANIIYEMKPNLNVSFVNVPVRTNSKGWRDNEFNVTKSSNTIRIVGLGDSVMFGWGANESDRYMDVLERDLNEHYPQYNWETMVFAAPGYNLPMEVEVLKHYALEYNPDIIVYGYVGNDHCLPNFLVNKKYNFWSSELFTVKVFDDIVLTKKNYSSDLLISTINGTQLYEYCEKDRVPLPYQKLVGEKIFSQSLQELVDISKDKSIPVVFFFAAPYPFDERRIPKEMIYANGVVKIYDYLKNNNITSYGNSSIILSHDDPHFSKFGHALVEQGLYQEIVKDDFMNKLNNKTKKS